MKHRLAQWMRAQADRLDPPPVNNIYISFTGDYRQLPPVSGSTFTQASGL